MQNKRSAGTLRKRISKEERLDRQRQEALLFSIGRDGLEAPPAWLDERGREEYKRVVCEAAKHNFLDNLDAACLGAYAAAYSQFVEATEHLQREGMDDNGKPSPWLTVQDRAAAAILKTGSKLGLFAADRLRLVRPKEKETPEAVNKWLEVLPKRK